MNGKSVVQSEAPDFDTVRTGEAKSAARQGRIRIVALFSAGTVLQQILNLGTGLVIARALGPDQYGISSILRNLYQILIVLAPLGLDLALQKYVSQNTNHPRFLLAQISRLRGLVALVNGSVVAICAFGGGELLESHIYHYQAFALLLTISIAGLPFGADSAVLSAVFRARGNPEPYILATLYFQPILRLVLLVPLLLTGFGLLSVTIVNSAVIAASSLLLVVYERAVSRTLVGHTEPDTFGRDLWLPDLSLLLRASMWMAMSIFLYSTLRLIDVLALGLWLPAREVGEYAALSTFAQLIQVFPSALSQTLGAEVAAEFKRANIKGIKKLYNEYMRSASILASPVFAAVAVFGDSMNLLFGHRFVFSMTVSVLLSIGYLTSATLAPAGYALSMTGRHRRETGILAAGSFALAMLCSLLVPRFGQSGAAIAVFMSFLGINLTRYFYIQRTMGMVAGEWADFIPPLLALAIAVAAKYAVFILAGRSLTTLVLATALFGSIYVAIVWIYMLTNSERERFALVLKRRLRFA